MFMDHCAIFQDHPNRAFCGHFECGWVAAIFFGLLRHQANILHRAAGGGIKLARFFEILDRLVIDGRVRIIRDHTDRVMFLAIWPPAFATCTDQRGHGCVNNHIRGDMQIGDAAITVDHIHRRARCHASVNRRFDIGLTCNAGQEITQTRIGVDAKCRQTIPKFFKDGRKIGFDRMAKDDRVRDLHHCGLHMQREQHAIFLRLFNLCRQKIAQRRSTHEGRINNRARGVANCILQNSLSAIFRNVNDARGCGIF